MDLDQIKDLMNLLESSKLKKLVFKKGDFEVQLEKESAPAVQKAMRVPIQEGVTESAFQAEASMKGERGGSHKPEVVEGSFVTSPMVGTFYGAPAPDQPPFVKIGDKVDENTVVCIIEAMKVMNEVKAGISGTIAEILADASQPVEFGTRLLRIT